MQILPSPHNTLTNVDSGKLERREVPAASGPGDVYSTRPQMLSEQLKEIQMEPEKIELGSNLIGNGGFSVSFDAFGCITNVSSNVGGIDLIHLSRFVRDHNEAVMAHQQGFVERS